MHDPLTGDCFCTAFVKMSKSGIPTILAIPIGIKTTIPVIHLTPFSNNPFIDIWMAKMVAMIPIAINSNPREIFNNQVTPFALFKYRSIKNIIKKGVRITANGITNISIITTSVVCMLIYTSFYPGSIFYKARLGRRLLKFNQLSLTTRNQ